MDPRVGSDGDCDHVPAGRNCPRMPSALVVLVLGTLSVSWFGLKQHGIEVVGAIHVGMPSLKLPRVGEDASADLFMGAIGIVLVLMAEALAAARTFAAKHKYDINPNGLLFFANSGRVRTRLRDVVRKAGRPLRGVLLNLEASPEVDVTSLEMLEQLRNEFQESGIDLYFARVSDAVRDLLSRSGFLHRLSGNRIFPGVEAAVSAFLEATRPAAESRVINIGKARA